MVSSSVKVALVPEPAFLYHCFVHMGNSASKKPKINKNHNKQKMFRIGISIGRNDLNLEGHLQMGYSGKTIN